MHMLIDIDSLRVRAPLYILMGWIECEGAFMSIDNAVLSGLPAVSGVLNYLVPSGEKPVNYTFDPPDGVPYNSGTYESHALAVHDGRSITSRLSLDEDGFTLVEHRSRVTNFYDADEVRRTYYPEARQLLADATGAFKVIVFDHLVRKRDPEKTPLSFGRPRDGGQRGPVGRVHADFTFDSAPARLRREVGDEAQSLLRHRFAIINVWRAIRGPIYDAPLAVLNGASVSPNDLIATDLVYPNRTGETYSVAFNPAHRWFYFSAMQPHEALLLKNYDSATNVRARVAPHSAFEDPTAPAGAPPRESIELRAFVFYPD
jgi:hypothetical protein